MENIKKCRNGHIAVRNKEGKCIQCKKEKASRHYRKNKEKVILSVTKYASINKEKIKETKRKRYLKNRNKQLEKQKRKLLEK